MAENRLIRANPLANRARQYAGMSVIFRQEETGGGTVTPAGGPVVPGFLWTPELWATRAEAATAVSEATAVPTPTTPTIQRQPESPPAGPTISAPIESLVVEAARGAAQPTSAPTAVTPMSTLAEPTPTAAVTAPTPSVQRHVEEPEPTPVQLTPSDAATPGLATAVPVSEPDTPKAAAVPPAVTPPSLLGRMGQRLGRLVSRPQPAATPSPASPMTRTEMVDTAVPATPMATPPPTAISMPAPVQRQPVEGESDLGSTAVPSAAPSTPETTAMPTPVPPTAPTPVQRQPETPVAPASLGATPTVPAPVESPRKTAVASPVTMSGLATAVPPTLAVQRQPETPPVVPVSPIAPISSPPITSAPSPAVTPSSPGAVGPAPVMPTASMAAVPAAFAAPTTPVFPAAPAALAAPPAALAAPPAALAAPPAALAAPAPLPAQPSAVQPPAAVQPPVTSPAPVQRQPEAASLTGAAPQMGAAPQTEDARNWRRLETIMRRHKEQEAAAEGTEAAGAESPPLTAASREPSLPSFAHPKPAAKPAPGTVSRQPAAPPREAPMVAVARGRAPGGGDTAVAPVSPPTTPPPATPPMETTIVSPTAASLAAPAILRAEAADDTLLVAPAETALPGSAGVEPVEGETPAADSPLQAVWPVQTVQRAEAPTAPTTTSPFPTPTEPPVRPPTPQDFWVEERLATVPPGMPTDSSVPLLRPRRPRPSRLAAAGADSPALMAEMGGTARPEPGEVAVLPTIQRQPESEVGLVPTEIGALPPDLWTLIGQPPPATAVAEPQPTPGQQMVMAKRDGEGGTAVSPATTPDTPTITPPTPDLSDYIQLAEGGEASSPAAPVEGGEAAEEKKEDGEVDINELARQVYAHIRNQLTIDRERERGRLIHKW